MQAPNDEVLVLPTLHYEAVDQVHRFLAEGDAPDPRPRLLAFDAEELLAIVGLRPFAPGSHQGPLVEAMALVLPMGADRVSVALPARVWSLDDPVPPVTPDVDLRQRVLMQVTVDGHGRAHPQVRTRLHPFAVPDDSSPGFDWDDAVDPGPGEGWVPDALAAMVEAREDIGTGSLVERQRQLVRLDELGHDVLLAPLGRRRLGA